MCPTSQGLSDRFSALRMLSWLRGPTLRQAQGERAVREPPLRGWDGPPHPRGHGKGRDHPHPNFPPSKGEGTCGGGGRPRGSPLRVGFLDSGFRRNDVDSKVSILDEKRGVTPILTFPPRRGKGEEGGEWVPAFAGTRMGWWGLDGGAAVVEVGVLLVGVAETEDRVLLHGPADYLEAEG